MNAPTRPVLRWHGGKWRLAPKIIAHFPPHTIYVEPYGGAASVLLQKPPLPAEVYNDLDGTVVNVFRVLRDPDNAAELKRRLELTLFARAEFEWSYETVVAGDAIDAAHKTIVRSFMGHGSDSVTRSCRTGFRARMSDERALPSQSWATYSNTIPFFVARLAGVVIEQRPALEIIERYDTPATLFYLDPPYIHSTRTSLIGRNVKVLTKGGWTGVHGYTHEMSDDDHNGLLGHVRDLAGMVVLSGYATALYDDLLPDWTRVELPALADGARPRTEVLWLNPACVAALEATCDQARLFA